MISSAPTLSDKDARATNQQSTVVAALTNNVAGVAADGTVAAITLTDPANLAAQGVINNQIANALMEVIAKQNAIIAALKASGQMASV